MTALQLNATKPLIDSINTTSDFFTTIPINPLSNINTEFLKDENDAMVQQDWEILCFIASSCIGIIVSESLFILFLSVRSLRTMKKQMRNSALSVFASSFAFSVVIFLCRTDVVFPFDFSIKWVCSLTFSASWSFYGITKMCTYFHFTHRIQCVLGESAYKVPKRRLSQLRCSILFFGVPTMFCAVSFLDKHEVHTPNQDIRLCTGSTSFSWDIGNVSIMVFLVFDFVISGTLVYLYCSKLKAIIKSVSEMDDEIIKMKTLQNLRDQMNKSTSMVLIAIVSTWIFFIVGNFFWWSLGWLIPLDVVINCLAIFSSYNVASKCYRVCCFPCVLCCDSANCINALQSTRCSAAERELAAYTASTDPKQNSDGKEPSVRSEAMELPSPQSIEGVDLPIPTLPIAPSFTSRDQLRSEMDELDVSMPPTVSAQTIDTNDDDMTVMTLGAGPILLHMPSHFDRDRYFATIPVIPRQTTHTVSDDGDPEINPVADPTDPETNSIATESVPTIGSTISMMDMVDTEDIKDGVTERMQRRITFQMDHVHRVDGLDGIDKEDMV